MFSSHKKHRFKVRVRVRIICQRMLTIHNIVWMHAGSVLCDGLRHSAQIIPQNGHLNRRKFRTVELRKHKDAHICLEVLKMDVLRDVPFVLSEWHSYPGAGEGAAPRARYLRPLERRSEHHWMISCIHCPGSSIWQIQNDAASSQGQISSSYNIGHPVKCMRQNFIPHAQGCMQLLSWNCYFSPDHWMLDRKTNVCWTMHFFCVCLMLCSSLKSIYLQASSAACVE